MSGKHLALDDAQALEVVAEYRVRVQQRRALRGAARVNLEGPDFKLNRPQRIAIESPNRLRFEVLGLFDVLAAMLVSDGREFGFFDATTGDVRRGPMTAELLWRLAQLDFEAEEVVSILLASPMPSSSMTLIGIWREPDNGLTFGYARLHPEQSFEGGVRCAGNTAGGHVGESACKDAVDALGRGAEFFRFDSTGHLREMRIIDPGWVMRFRVSFEDYREVAADFASVESNGDAPGNAMSQHLFPMRISIHSPQVGAWARFEWKRVMLTDALPDRLFRLPESIASGG